MTTAVSDSPQVSIYRYSPELYAAPDFRVHVNGQEVFVYDTPVGAFGRFGLIGRARVVISARGPFEQVIVRPLSRKVQAQTNGQEVNLMVDGPVRLSVEFDRRLRRPLFLVADPPQEGVPKRDDPSVLWFEAGRVHDAGVVELTDGQTVYLEPGAVVRGAVIATGRTGIRILGRGVLDGAGFAKHQTNMVRLTSCREAVLDGPAIVNSPSWTVPLFGCDDVVVRNICIISGRDNDDGIDVVGSQRIRIEDCLIRTKDDCVVVKAVSYRSEAGLRDVRNVEVRRCVLWNAEWGNAMEIGFETRCEEISNVLFADCDVIHCEHEGYYSGGVFTIHNGDRATVRDVRYQDIRVEDAQEKLIDFKVLHSHYSKDEQRGQIRDVVLRDIQILDGALPPSIIQSFDREHRVENVTIQGLTHLGRAVRNQLEAHLVCERARNVKIVE